MITSDAILEHFYKIAPLVTDRFCEKVTPISATVESDLTLHVTVPSVSGFTINKRYPVSGVTLRNEIVSAVGSAATGWDLTTLEPHRISPPIDFSDKKTFKLDSIWLNDNVVTSVSDSTHVFTRNGETLSPSGAFLLEPLSAEQGYLNLIAIAGNVLVFEFNEGYVYPCQCSVDYVVSRLNVSVVADIARASEVYATSVTDSSNSLWAFIIMGDRASIRNSDQEAGLVYEARGQVQNFLVSTGFTVLVYWSRQSTQESARKQINEAYGLVYQALNRVFFGAKLNDSTYRTVPDSSGQASDTEKPNYIHAYDYQTIDNVDFGEDGIKPEHLFYNVPIREIDMDLYISDGLTTPQLITAKVLNNG